jgi:hypothetical protein
MRIDPTIEKEKKQQEEIAKKMEVYTRKAAIVLVFLGVYFFIIKILFL